MMCSIKSTVCLAVEILIFVIFSFNVSAVERSTVTDEQMREAAENALSWERERLNADSLAEGFISEGMAGEAEADWFILSEFAIGKADDYTSYAAAARTELKEKLEKSDEYYLTEFARTDTVINMIGGEYVDLSALDYESGGDNELIWLIISQENGGCDYTEQMKNLLSRQTDGGFGAEDTDADVTAMALNVLEPNSEAANLAVDFLKKYYAENAEKLTSETAAQMIIGLCAQGINPSQTLDFTTENGVRLIDILLSRQTESGGFSHKDGGEENLQATMQALTALAAMGCYSQNECGLYSTEFEAVNFDEAENLSAECFDDYDKNQLNTLTNPAASDLTKIKRLKERAEKYSADEYLTEINEKLDKVQEKADEIEKINTEIRQELYPADSVGLPKLKKLININDKIDKTDKADRELVLSADELQKREKVLKIRLFAAVLIFTVTAIILIIVKLKRRKNGKQNKASFE